jgi:hypothetical protein
VPNICTHYRTSEHHDWSLFKQDLLYTPTDERGLYIIVKRYHVEGLLSLSLSLSWLSIDLGFGRGSANQPRRAFVVLQITDKETNLRLPRHLIKNCINNTLYSYILYVCDGSHGTRSYFIYKGFFFLKKKK